MTPTTNQRLVVTGAAGFIGSHLCEALLRRGHEVVGVDDLSSGQRHNLAPFVRHPSFSFREHDIDDGVPVHGPIDGLFHLIPPLPAAMRAPGAPALPTPPNGLEHVAEFAHRRDCRLLVVGATGESYEDPFEPAEETSPVPLPRIAQDSVRIARLHGAYGPRMEPEDEPTLTHLLLRGLTGQPLVVADDVTSVATCFVSDLIAGMITLFQSNLASVPVDLGDATGHPIDEVVEAVRAATGAEGPLERQAATCPSRPPPGPDTSIAIDRLGWSPRVELAAGIRATAAWLREELGPTVGRRAA